MSLQKYVLNPIIALFLGWGVARFVGHYHLLEFSGAPGICFGLFSLSYLLLSQKYDLILSLVFLVLALGIFTQSWKMKTPAAPVETTDKIAIRQLSLITVLTKAHQMTHGRFPEKLEDLMVRDLKPSPLNFSFCEINSCAPHLKEGLAKETHFIITAFNKSDDKPGQLWYMTDSFEIFARSSLP
jgi:hypothetical protein